MHCLFVSYKERNSFDPLLFELSHYLFILLFIQYLCSLSLNFLYHLIFDAIFLALPLWKLILLLPIEHLLIKIRLVPPHLVRYLVVGFISLPLFLQFFRNLVQLFLWIGVEEGKVSSADVGDE